MTVNGVDWLASALGAAYCSYFLILRLSRVFQWYLQDISVFVCPAACIIIQHIRDMTHDLSCHVFSVPCRMSMLCYVTIETLQGIEALVSCGLLNPVVLCRVFSASLKHNNWAR